MVEVDLVPRGWAGGAGRPSPTATGNGHGAGAYGKEGRERDASRSAAPHCSRVACLSACGIGRLRGATRRRP
jgi:hypothetical protein